MNSQIATASKLIHAPAKEIYNILADYRSAHPRILPKPYFLSMDVEAGGFGAGTIVRFQMRLLGQTQDFRSLITEPEPGRVLMETDMRSKVATTFLVESAGDDHGAHVTISTTLKARNLLEAWVAKSLLQKVYRQELDILARLAEGHAESIQISRV